MGRVSLHEGCDWGRLGRVPSGNKRPGMSLSLRNDQADEDSGYNISYGIYSTERSH